MTRRACDQCNKVFRTESGLEWHLKRVHQPDTESVAPDARRLGDIGIPASLAALEELVERIDGRQDVDADNLEAIVDSWNRRMTEIDDKLAKRGTPGHRTRYSAQRDRQTPSAAVRRSGDWEACSG